MHAAVKSAFLEVTEPTAASVHLRLHHEVAGRGKRAGCGERVLGIEDRDSLLCY